MAAGIASSSDARPGDRAADGELGRAVALVLLALRDVVQEGVEARGALVLDGRDRHLDRELVPVAVEGLHLEAAVEDVVSPLRR